VAIEIMLNSPLISDLIFKGEVHEIKELMKKSRELGMQTFDQSLFDLHEADLITYEDALRNADSVNDLRLPSSWKARPRKPRPVRRHRTFGHRLMSTIFDFRRQPVRPRRQPEPVPGKVLLIVNTASKCGFTPQYKGWKRCTSSSRTRAWKCWASRATSSAQEPGTPTKSAPSAKELRRQLPAVCQDRRQRRSRPSAVPEAEEGRPGILGTEGIKWNFTKFLVRKDGTVYNRYAPPPSRKS
jgi:glutathione peroxidase-family protein